MIVLIPSRALELEIEVDELAVDLSPIGGRIHPVTVGAVVVHVRAISIRALAGRQ